MRHRVVALAAFVLLASAGFSYPRLTTTAAAPPEPAGQRRTTRGRARQPARRAPNYTRFDHRVAKHQEQKCDACHKFPSANWKEARASDPFPDVTEYPEHASCLNCHRTQFFARGERPQPRICAVCHTGVTPRQTARWPFPSLAAFDETAKGRAKSPDFAVNFPHAKHEGLFGEYQEPAGGRVRFVTAAYRPAPQDDPAKLNAACATCHQTFQPQGDSDVEYVTTPPKDLAEGAFWPKKGTFKTAPRDHSSCFTCHSADGGMAPAPTDCATCHKLLPAEDRNRLTAAHDDFDPKLAAAVGVTDRPTLLRWSRREAARFRHEFAPHDLACASCHNVAAMDTTAEATKRVPVMSCGGEGSGCHVEPDGSGTFQLELAEKRKAATFDCAKCHVVNGRQPTPDAHAAAGAVKK